MKLWIMALVGAGLITAQNPNSSSSYLGRSWVGLLVSASCSAPAERVSATEEADRTVTERVTTPAVDAAGTRGSSEPNDTVTSIRGDIPQTGDVMIRSRGRKIKDPGWTQARRQAAALGPVCRVNGDTRQFGLVLPDGGLLRFNDVANAKIASQLQSRGISGTGKILRVVVVGKLDGGLLAVDEVQI